MATNANLFVDAGANYNNKVTVTTPTGLPLNLTGYTAKSQIRKSYGSSIAYNFNASIHNAEFGRVQIELTALESQVIPPGRYLYDIEITQTSTGEKTRVVEGLVIVSPQITQI